MSSQEHYWKIKMDCMRELKSQSSSAKLVLAFTLQPVGDTETFWAQEQQIWNRLSLTLIWHEHEI